MKRQALSTASTETEHTSDRLLTPLAASQELHVSEGTLSVWRSTGRYLLPYVKIGRKVRYRQSDIQTFIQRRVHNFGGASDE
ncbi:helix-turn-helix domain-containing protein [Simiduia aestuariiviva]|uniref:Putative DNA-binding transcriptional regulator AlpA n=1 Tax=Simiduia aestuariiviva TaxID=1510459 RepID=A0A839UPM0_9GAMM|nr:helix-turn-helix domain-containing protein [Simiduia aestuariiviva]MBB3170164.1 putative DNA-binding transcriptional regulator AlpA [Simiduia aestuariiviva]